MVENFQAGPVWLPIAVASVPALASIVAAVIAGIYAKRARVAEAEAAHLRELENRLASAKFDVYKPMIELFRNILTPEGAQAVGEDEIQSKTADFSTWISIFGSDEAVRAFHRFMQGAFYQAPGLVSMRLYADFVLAARKDMGYDDTDVTPLDLLGIRIKDIYEERANYEVATLPFAEVCEKYGWVPPWNRQG